MHNELEEKYINPLARKLVEKTNGDDYYKYLKAKDRARTALDKTRSKPSSAVSIVISDTSSQDFPEMPMLKYDTHDLVDPINRYEKNNQMEKKLTKIIKRANGECEEPPKLPERDTINLKRWKALSDTRFYSGDTTKGRKTSPSIFKSTVTECIDNYSPFPERKIRTNSGLPEYRKDHIQF